MSCCLLGNRGKVEFSEAQAFFYDAIHCAAHCHKNRFWPLFMLLVLYSCRSEAARRNPYSGD